MTPEILGSETNPPPQAAGVPTGPAPAVEGLAVSLGCGPNGQARADLVAMLLADKRSESTRRAYRHDLNAFFDATYACEVTPDLVRQFLTLSTLEMTELLLKHKARLIEKGRAEATVNRSLAAVTSLVTFARRIGATEADLRGQVDGERVTAYRDTRGIGRSEARTLLNLPDRSTLKGKRDYSLLLLLLENALRRSEVVGVSVSDFDRERRCLWIVGKGKGTQRESVTVSVACAAALIDYLEARSPVGVGGDPLFVNVSPAYAGRRLTPDGLYKIVRHLASAVGQDSLLSPHRLRHTAITLALDVSGGDIRRVQRLSRHARMETLCIYDDNRTDLQGEITTLLSAALQPDGSVNSRK